MLHYNKAALSEIFYQKGTEKQKQSFSLSDVGFSLLQQNLNQPRAVQFPSQSIYLKNKNKNYHIFRNCNKTMFFQHVNWQCHGVL